MLLIYTQKTSPRISYIFRHICTRILGIEIKFTSIIEELIAHPGPKMSYGKQPLGNEFFVQSHGLLSQQGFDAIDIVVKDWDETKCFFQLRETSLLPFDIFAAGFYLLSRYEEYLPHVKDELGRFPASESIGYKNEFLQQPVVDVWAYKFKKILQEHFPDLSSISRKLTVHSIIDAKKPFLFKQQGFFRTLTGYSKDLTKFKFRTMAKRTQAIFGLRRDPFDTFKWMISASKKGKNRVSVFFQLGNDLRFEDSLNTQRRRFKMLVKYVSDYKEIGLICSHEALSNYDLLKEEKGKLEEITNRNLQSSINALYLVSLPDIYRELVELEIEKDFTMFYENNVGFRAGTCTPFLFYDLDYEIRTPLIIHPISVTTKAFEKKYPSEINKTINNIYDSVAAVNGTFSMMFTNRDFTSTERNLIWRSIFSEKLN